jgi:hypothetical protein
MHVPLMTKLLRGRVRTADHDFLISKLVETLIKFNQELHRRADAAQKFHVHHTGAVSRNRTGEPSLFIAKET